jgi:hypothetical protein
MSGGMKRSESGTLGLTRAYGIGDGTWRFISWFCFLLLLGVVG